MQKGQCLLLLIQLLLQCLQGDTFLIKRFLFWKYEQPCQHLLSLINSRTLLLLLTALRHTQAKASLKGLIVLEGLVSTQLCQITTSSLLIADSMLATAPS